MNDALRYLLWHSARNRMRGQLVRLRRPRYLFAVLAGALYFGGLLFNSRVPSPITGSTSSALGQLFYTSLIFLTIASGWVFGSDRPALVFSEAEVQMLFPAPLTRASLVRYKVVQAQMLVLFSVLVWVVLLRRGGAALPFWARAISLWVILSTLYLHRVGASLVRTSAVTHGARGIWTNIVPIVIVTAAVSAVVLTVLREVPNIRVALVTGHGPEAFARLAASQPLVTILFPFRVLVAPLFADTYRHWLIAILPAFALMAAHYPWVTRTDAAFEEMAAEYAAKRARVMSTTRDVRRRRVALADGPVSRPWFALSPTGHPAVSIIWKNVLAFTRALRLTTVFVLVSVIAIIGAVVYTDVKDWSELASVAETLCTIPMMMLVVLGPGFVRADLRQDLLQLDQLRSYPLRGATIVAAEIASSTVILTAIQYVLVFVAASIALFDPHLPVRIVPATLLAIIVLPVLNAISLTVANGAALLFPGWVRLGDGRAAGVEAMGQNVLAILVSLIITVVALIIPTVVTTLVAAALVKLYVHIPGVWDFVAGTPVGALVAAAELWIVIQWLGRVLARTDLAQIEPPT